MYIYTRTCSGSNTVVVNSLFSIFFFPNTSEYIGLPTEGVKIIMVTTLFT